MKYPHSKTVYLPTVLSTLVFLGVVVGTYVLFDSSLKPVYRPNRQLHDAEYALDEVMQHVLDGSVADEATRVAAARDAMADVAKLMAELPGEGLVEESVQLQARLTEAAGRPLAAEEWRGILHDIASLQVRLELEDEAMLMDIRDRFHGAFAQRDYFLLLSVLIIIVMWLVNSFWLVPRYAVRPLERLLETQHHQEAQIRESEAHLAAIANSVTSGIVLADNEGRIKFWNPAAERMFGRSSASVLGLPLADLLLPLDLAERALLEEMLAPDNAGHRSLEATLQRSDGTPLPLHLTFTSTTLEGMIHTVGVFRDLTEQRRLEAELDLQHAELLAIYDSAPVIIGVVDDSGTILYSNPALTEYVNPRHGSCLGMRLCEALNCTRAGEIEGGCGVSAHCAACPLQSPLRTALDNDAGRHDFEYHEVLVRDEAAYPTTLLGTAVRLDSKGDPRVLLCLQDITERKAMEEALMRSEERMALVLDAATDGWWDWDLVTNQPYYSARWWEMLGYEPDALPADADLWRRLMHPDDLEEISLFFDGVLQSKRETYEVEFRHQHLDGHYVPVLSKGHVLRNAEGVAVRVCGFNLDLTEDKRREDEYKNLIATSMDGFWVSDRSGHLLRVNEAICNMLQYPEHVLLQMNIADIDANESHVEVERHIDLVLRTGHDLFESRLRRRDGTVIDVEISSSCPREDGTQVFVFLRDISQRKAFEASLLASETRFRSYIEHAPIGVVVVDRRGYYLDVNDAAASHLGYNREEFLTLGVNDMLDPGSQAAGLEYFRSVVRGEHRAVELLLRKKDGNPAPTEVHAARLDADRFLGFHVDLTERKKAEDTLLYQAALDSVLAEVSQAMVAEEHGANMAEPIMHHAMRLTGSTLSCLITPGKNAGEVTVLRPGQDQLTLPRGECCGETPDPDTEIFEALWSQVGRVEMPATSVVSLPTATNPDLALPTNVLVLPVLQRGKWMGQIILANAPHEYSAMDLSSLGRLAELYRLHLQGVQIRQELEDSRQQFLQAQKMEAIGRLAGGVAHDFNNILGVIIGYSDFLLKSDALGEESREYLDAVRKAALRGADLTRQLLAFARKQTVQPRQLDLNESVGAMLKLLGRLAGEHINMHWHPVNRPLQVRIDPSQFDQLLANLIVNARDAISGNGTITIETACEFLSEDTCAIHGHDHKPGTFAVLTVTDSGCGMDAATLNHIFEPFFTTKPEGQGTGLGLATVHGIVHQNGGFVLATSEVGHGTTFRIHIPLQEVGIIENPDGADSALGDPSGTETILLVDDQSDFREACRKILECLGYHVITARDGEQAIQRLNGDTDKVQLLITDLVMPGMNGRELWQQLSARCPNLRCIYMSGYTADVIGEQGVLDESVVYIDKPFSMSTLARRIREVLDA
jgi:PAS domain S-box-containing protein